MNVAPLAGAGSFSPRSERRAPWRLLVLAALAGGGAASCSPKPGAQPAPTPTFNRDIAPIVFQHCSPCHRPGQAAPFSLLTYADVQKRARNIAEVVERRLMPPWLPDAADGPFVGQRLLNTGQIAAVLRWIEQGTPEGEPTNLPPPRWPDEWQLGAPDLVIRMAEPYPLAADGPDVYRNFVIAIPTTARRFVKAIEFQPGTPRVVHHAFLRIDATRESRRFDERDPAPGFPGLHTPPTAQTPEGQFLSWQPGKVTVPGSIAWLLETNCDLVLQTHLRPSGKPDTLQAAVAFYFTDTPPAGAAFKLGMRNFFIDIPAGATRHVVTDSLPLAADVDVLSVLPHAHYLAREVHGFATLPDGTVRSLLRIADWDLNWQGDFTFVQPVFLPRGSTISMRYTFDNSTNNVRNPHSPPRRVRYGLQSDDEMAEFWLQVVPRRPEDLAALARAYQPRVFQESVAYNNYLLGLNPNDARARCELGKASFALGHTAAAERELRHAASLDPAFDEPHYWLGLLFRTQAKLDAAREAFAAALRLNPDNAKAHGNLGLVLLDQGKPAEAEPHFRAALRLNPQDQIARESLENISKAKGATIPSPNR